MKSFFPILLLALAFCMACVHEQEEIPSLPALPLFKDVTPVSEIKEPGCELQMELDPLWHHNQYRDSNYIREVMVNPNNPNQWVYIQDVLNPGVDWTLLWFVDLEKREKRRLDSISFASFGELSWGGEFLSYEQGLDMYLLNLKDQSLLEFKNTDNLGLSPNGNFLVYGNVSSYLYDIEKSTVIAEWPRGVTRTRWTADSKEFYTHTANPENSPIGLKKVNVENLNLISEYSTRERIGPGITCISLDSNEFFLRNHYVINLHSKSPGIFFPHCDRQYFERIIPLTNTREYLVIKSYYETIEPKTTLVYQHFHVFDENWENERRVTLNFDF